MELSADTLKVAYYGLSVLFIAGFGFNGWRQGVARQLMTLAAIACAYAAAWYGASSAAPVFAFLKYPPQVTKLIGGAAVGCATFLGLHGMRRWFLKSTAQQKNPKVRLSFGILGAIVGVTFGSLVFFVTTDLVRAVGTVAKSRLEDVEKEKQNPAFFPPEEPGPLVRNFAKLETALGEGASGKFLHRYENTSTTHAFATLARVAIMISRPESVERFLAYPGVDQLVSHRKLLALRNDPEIAELLKSRSFIKLLRHEKVLALATDDEFNALMKQMQFEKALDHALEPMKLPDAPREAQVTPLP